MVEGEDLVQYVSRIGLPVQKLAMLGGAKDADDVNVHIVRTLTAYYKVEMNVLLSSPGLTRSNIEGVVISAYMSHKQNVGYRGREMPYMIATPAVLNQPVQGETGWERIQKRSRMTGKSVRNSSSRHSSGSTTVAVAVPWARRIV